MLAYTKISSRHIGPLKMGGVIVMTSYCIDAPSFERVAKQLPSSAFDFSELEKCTSVSAVKTAN